MWFTINRMGVTRIVFIFEHVVVKIPSVKSWKLFLNGLLANISEKTFSGMVKTPGIPTVYYADRFGFILIAKRIRPIRHRGLFWVELTKLVAESNLHSDFWMNDAKPENFGFDTGMKFIKLDLG